MDKLHIFNLIILFFLLICCGNLCVWNIDPHNGDMQYVWGENIGRLNFEPSYGGVQIYNDGLEGNE